MYKIFNCLTLFLLVQVCHGQVASFTSDVSAGCAPLIVQFDGNASSGSGPLTYHWDFGNGNTAVGTDQDSPGAVYTTPGNYTVSLQVEDASGFSAPFTRVVTVYNNPIADFQISGATEGCSPLGISFVDNSVPTDGPINTWIWDFGDGNSSLLQNPSHLYFDQGENNVKLIVRDVNGCQGDTTYLAIVRVGYQQDVDFETALPDSNRLTCNNTLTINFEDQTTYLGTGPYTYEWDFGDGNTANTVNTSHTFNGFGTYDVTLTITDEYANCVTSLTKPSYVNLLDVIPDFDMTPSTGCVSQTVFFSNTSNTLEGNQIVTWHFGDGNSLTGPATDPAIINPTHNYPIGIYYPSISMDINNGECFESYTSPDPIVVKDLPTVSYTGDTLTSCQAPFDVMFSPSSPDAEQWLWDFGDGNTSNTEIPTHTYTTEGSFDVTLTVTDSLGCQNTFSRAGYVNIQAPTPRFTSDIFNNADLPNTWDGRDINFVAGGCIPLDITFTDLSTSLTPIVDWSWDFGDGNSATSVQNPTNTYTVAGEYPVTMTITTVDGCVLDYTCDSCAVAGDLPDAQIDDSNLPLQQCCMAEHDFINTTAPGTADYFWYEISNGDYYGTDPAFNNWDYAQQIPVNPNPQVLDFTFYAWDRGCLDTLFYPAFTTLHQPYVQPNMMVDPCIYEDSLRITGPTVLGITDSLSWNFTHNNQFIYNDITPAFKSPEVSGNYGLTVTAWDLTNIHNLSNGDTVCSCTFTETSYFPGLPIDYDFTSTVDSGCVPLAVQFDGPTENLVAWDWNFANTLTDSIEDPSTVYDTIGDYNVRLIVTDVAGCQDTITKTQFINAIGTNVYILPSSVTGCLPFDITFADTSKVTAPLISRTWDFETGDQFAGNDSIITFTFDALLPSPALQKDGIEVTLTTVDTNGCTNTGSTTIYAGDPQADFIYTSHALCEADSIIFTGIDDDTVGIAPFTYDWELDNPSPTSASGQTTTKNFPEGTYNVRLIMTDSIGCRDTSAYTILDVVTPQPEAIIDVSRTTGTCPPIVVSFGDSSNIGRATISEWYWDFGDGSTSRIQHPSNIYSTENSFDVSLTVIDTLGCQDSTLIPGFFTLTGVVGGFDVYNNIVCVNESATFIANSPNAATFTWDFGDGNIGTGDTIVHTYTFASTRYPILVMKDTSGLCSRTFRDTVTILPKPDIDLSDSLSVCIGESGRIGITLEPDEMAEWSTGSFLDSITVNVAGIYEVEVTNLTSGCVQLDSTEFFVVGPPNISTGGTKDVCEGDNTSITVNTSEPSIQFEWFENSLPFGTGQTIDNVAVNGSRTFAVTGTNPVGCVSYDTLTLIPEPPPTIEIADTMICIGDEAIIYAIPNEGRNPGEIYSWYRNNTLIKDSIEATITVKEAAPYRVDYDWGSCKTSTTFTIFYKPPVIPNVHEPVVFCSETEQGITISPGLYPRYRWLDDGSRGGTFFATSVGYYPVEIYNEFGCSAIDSMTVYDICPPRVYIGNAFTPNGDGNNDVFLAKGDYVDFFELFIFNRWGEVIFHTMDIHEPWNGFYLNKDIPAGVYPYVMKYNGTHPDYKDLITEEGKVTVIR